jgi:diaminopimelate epimerase
MTLDYTVMDPTGNITVLVTTPVPVEEQARLGAALLAAEPDAEQVGFVRVGDSPDADVGLRMAAGEFCGNATMSAAALHCLHWALDDATVRVRASGASAPVTVAAAKQPGGGYACAVDMPRPLAVQEVSLSLEGTGYRFPLVRFEGISHLILPGDFDRDLAERAAPKWCADLGAEALGLMLLDEAAGRMDPLVWVPAGGSLYWERSCASGTAAVGAWLAARDGAEARVLLSEPGGVLSVTAAAPVGAISLRGTVKLLRVGQISTEQQDFAQEN